MKTLTFVNIIDFLNSPARIFPLKSPIIIDKNKGSLHRKIIYRFFLFEKKIVLSRFFFLSLETWGAMNGITRFLPHFFRLFLRAHYGGLIWTKKVPIYKKAPKQQTNCSDLMTINKNFTWTWTLRISIFVWFSMIHM